LLATDFDGTVSPIVHSPHEAVMDDAMREVLSAAAACPDIVVAFVSGRDAGDVRDRTHGINAWIAGGHGLECFQASGALAWETPQNVPQPEPSIVGDLRQHGIRIEPKRYGIAIHFRDTDIGDAQPIVRFLAWARSQNLEIVRGRRVIEARPRGVDKCVALRRIARSVGAQRIVYAGDDTTDFRALRWAARRGTAIFVDSAETELPAMGGVQHVASIAELRGAFEREIQLFNRRLF
jgi:trehalose 6-phosphate phosphatase